MAEEIRSDVNVNEEQAKSATKKTAGDPALLAAGGSVLLSLALYYLKGNKQQGIFVGLWAPTFLAFASYFKQKEAAEEAKRAV